MTVTTETNAYWEAVREHVSNDRFSGGPCVDTYGSLSSLGSLGVPSKEYGVRVDRFELCGRYSWTVTDPATVGFVLDHCGPLVVDPMAGSGWWAYLLEQDHVDVTASDINPPNGTDANHWHRGSSHVPVARLDAVQAVLDVSPEHTLLLSWPPYDSDTGYAVLSAYCGNRVIYIGEGEGGCCGDNAMFDLFKAEWTEVADHRPVQFYGPHDWVTVYERKGKN